MAQRLDQENYSADETITIKMPFTLPYLMDGKEYERVDGAFEYKGEFFKLVKQKVEHDTLYIVCIKDHQEKRLFNFMASFVKLSSDVPVSSSQALKLLSSLIKDYIPQVQSKTTTSIGWTSEVSTNFHQDRNHISIDFPVHTPPPRA